MHALSSYYELQMLVVYRCATGLFHVKYVHTDQRPWSDLEVTFSAIYAKKCLKYGFYVYTMDCLWLRH